tara:strand:+ start:427 stop:576 length:150 start_codon:yes stop_codon:yes gene_type:complete
MEDLYNPTPEEDSTLLTEADADVWLKKTKKRDINKYKTEDLYPHEKQGH